MTKQKNQGCPFMRMRPCVEQKCMLWRVDTCVFMNMDKELFNVVELMLGGTVKGNDNQNHEEESHV